MSFMKPNPFNQILIFTDGACSGNPGPGGYGAILVLPNGEVEEIGGKRTSTTNNRMEMMAVIEGLHKINLADIKTVASSKNEIWVLTDSTYTIKGITQWIYGWKKKGWKTTDGKEVSNKDLWEQMIQIVDSLQQIIKIEWKYLRGHIGTPGNERSDEIAVQFSKGRYCELYKGSLLKYAHPIYDMPEDLSVPTYSTKKQTALYSKKKQAPHSYLSYVNGVLQRHQTWPECEAQVKGRPRAKFKKSTSPENEIEIIASWGLNKDSIKKI